MLCTLVAVVLCTLVAVVLRTLVTVVLCTLVAVVLRTLDAVGLRTKTPRQLAYELVEARYGVNKFDLEDIELILGVCNE